MAVKVFGGGSVKLLVIISWQNQEAKGSDYIQTPTTTFKAGEPLPPVQLYFLKAL